MSENGQTQSRAGVMDSFVPLDPDACYRALTVRDPRFDGAFFVGVKTTGVYCRPICSARTPGRDRCVFFTRAALAEQGGFRACFRCRPERAPGHANVDAVSRLVADAARKIDDGALNEGSVEELAVTLGSSSRHLRRAMQRELGLGPVELATSRRIGLARELLLGTMLPIAEIAFASGFSSVRRFNDAYRALQKTTPSEVRRPTSPKTSSILGPRVVLDVRAPFDAKAAFDFLRARSVEGLDAFLGEAYVRAVALGGRAGTIAITPAKGKSALVLEVSSNLGPSLMTIVTRVRHMFDTDADPIAIGTHLAKDPILRERVAKRPALRVMGAFDTFEWAARAVLGQQVSVRAARTLAARLVAKFGTAVVAIEGGPTHAFPAASTIAAASEDALAAIGLTRARAKTLRGLALAIDEGRVVLDRIADREATMRDLLALPGVGPWTAEYIAMRALAWPDAFPAGDLGLKKALGGVSTAECELHSERWRPWRAYAAAHLWTGLAEETG